MSIYPCEVHGTVVDGTLDSFYVRMQDARDTYFRKVRLCRDHAIEYLDRHDTDWKLIHPMYGVQFAGICSRCDGVYVNAMAMSRMYIDVYIKGHEPLKYTGEYCHECSMIIIDSLDLVLEDNKDDGERLARIRRGLPNTKPYDRSEQSEGRGVVNGSGGGQDDPKAPNDDGEGNEHPAHVANRRRLHGAA